MSESPNVFISWSGDRSARAAKAIAKLLPDFVPAAKPWLSISSIDKGVRWREATAVALESANAGIFCLTPENLTAPWLLFEAGAIAKRLDTKTRAWTYLLCGLDHKNIDDPLDMFQGTKPSKQDTHEFLHSIQKTLEPEFDLERFNRRFEKNWHDLDEELKAVAAMQGPAPQEPNLHKTVADIHGLLEALSVPIAETWAEINTTREKRLAEESNHRWLPSSVTFNAPAPPSQAATTSPPGASPRS